MVAQARESANNAPAPAPSRQRTAGVARSRPVRPARRRRDGAPGSAAVGQAAGGARWQRDMLVGALAVVVGGGLVVAVWVLGRPLALLLAAIILAQAVAPVVAWTERRLPRGLAIILVYLGVLALSLASVALLVLPLRGDLMVAVGNAPAVFDRVQERLARLDPTEHDVVVAAAVERLPNILPEIAEGAAKSAALALEGFLVFLMAIYWSFAGRQVVRVLLWRVPTAHRAHWAGAVREINDLMGGYVRTILIEIAISAVVLAVAFWLLRLEYALVVAAVAALLKAIPVIGRTLGVLPPLAVGLLGESEQLVAALAFYIVFQFLEAHLLKPRLMAHQISVSPLLIIFALVAGGAVGGVLGALVAVPLAGVLQVLILRGVNLAEEANAVG